MKTLSLLTAFVSAAFVSLVGAQNPKTEPAGNTPGNKSSEHSGKPDGHTGKEKDHAMPATQAEFLKTAARAGMAEVKCAQIALAKSENAKVRELAAMLVKDHSAANQELKGIADKLNISVPSEQGEKAKKKNAELEKKTGKDFDTAFLNGMATDHREGITLFEAGSKVSSAQPVLTFVEKTLPTLRSHAEKIKELGGVDELMNPDLKVAPPTPKVPQHEIPSPR